MKNLNRIINKYIVLSHCLKFFQIISGLYQTSKMKRFAQTVNSYKWNLVC